MRAATACAAWMGQPERADLRQPVDAERLMAWAIGRERADLICEDMRERPPGGVSCRWPALGTFIDCARAESASCHPDAEAAYMTARAVLSAGKMRLVKHFARLGTRPDWAPFKVVEAGPELVFKDGKWKARVRRPGGGPGYCPVVWRDRGAELEDWRETYLDWHAALGRVEAALGGVTFRKWRLVPLRAPERPWERE